MLEAIEDFTSILFKVSNLKRRHSFLNVDLLASSTMFDVKLFESGLRNDFAWKLGAKHSDSVLHRSSSPE
jgi:hypothetical protein